MVEMLRTGMLLLTVSACFAQVPEPVPGDAPVDDHAVLEAARRNALAFSATLPDFMCAQLIRRLEKPAGAPAADKDWQRRDQLLVRLSYVGGKEDYRLISVDNRATDQTYLSVLGAKSTGEFGSWLEAIFNPSTQAQFKVAGRRAVNHRPAVIFSYRVDREHSHYDVSYRVGLQPNTATVAYHGSVSVDLDTSQVMSVEIESDDLPARFPLRASSILLEYAFTKISGREFVLPSYAETRMATSRMKFRNEIEFRNYRKFQAEASLCFADCDKRPGAGPARAAVEEADGVSRPNTVTSVPASSPAPVPSPVPASRPAPAPVPVITVASLDADSPYLLRPSGPPAEEHREDRLITFDVVALDRRGKPVRGLHAKDLRLQENDRTPLVEFCRSNSPPETELPAPGNEYSNRLPAAAPGAGARVILVDARDAVDWRVSRDRLAAALAEYGSEDRVYLYFLTAHALHGVRPMPQPSSPEPRIALREINLDKAYQSSMQAADANTPDEDAYHAVMLLCSRLASWPGRKSIVWVTRGMDLGIGAPGGATPFAEAVETAQRARVAIYTVGGAPGDIAAATGGRASDDLDIVSALKTAADDSVFSYTIGYYSGAVDGKIRSLRVSASHGGIRLLAPDRYVAAPHRVVPFERERAILSQAVTNPAGSGEIGVRVMLDRGQPRPEQRHIRIRLDAQDLRLYRQDEGATYGGSVAVALAAVDASGSASLLKATQLTIQLTGEQAETAFRDGLDLSTEHALGGSAQELRVIVLDRYSSAIGSLTIPLAQ